MKKEDVTFLVTFLHSFSAKWKEIGLCLKFDPNELDIIGHDDKSVTQCLVQMLSQWSQWPTVDHCDSPTLEKLCEALGSRLVKLGAQANELYDLRIYLPSQQKK